MRSASWNVGEMRAAKSLQSKEDLRCAHSLTYGPAGSVSAEETLAALDAVRETKMAAEMERITQMYLQPDAQFPGLAWDPENNSQRDGLVDSAPAKEGADFPSPCMDWPLYSSDGQLSEDVQDAIMQGPLVLTHFRGSWCTICTLALRHLSEALPLLRRKFGASVIAVSGQLPPFNSDFEECNHFDFPVLSDKGLHLAERLGICYKLTPQEAVFYDFVTNGWRTSYGEGCGFKLPLPATFVLEQTTGRIAYAFVDSDLSKRSRLLRIEAALQSLRDGEGHTMDHCDGKS
mmetsp:Transcript_8383/g.25180  ORF Transcript_8383/g.25180 Transcript_8383/m.25180 type:complete len:289 (+) Transcript_8383:317-1183(+)